MEYLLSKVLPLFVYPLGAAILLVLVTIRLAWIGRRGAALLSGWLAIGILWVGGMPATADFLLQSLQDRYPPVAVKDAPRAEAIVLLGGVARAQDGAPAMLDLGQAVDRVRHAARLFKAGKAPLVIVSGGATDTAIPEAEVMADLLVEWGVSRAAMVLESESRNTRENALNVQAILQSRSIGRVLLVTSAFHMRRAEAVFHRVGVETIPAATDYHLEQSVSPLLDWLPDVEALFQSTYAMKEYIGMQVYRWRGWVE